MGALEHARRRLAEVASNASLRDVYDVVEEFRSPRSPRMPQNKKAMSRDEQEPLCEDAAARSSSDLGVAVRMSLQVGTAGATVEETPAPHLLATGPCAECLRPLVLAAGLCLLGAVVDVLLVLLLSPLEWPVQKRIYTLRGAPAGSVCLELSSDGCLSAVGDEASLLQAHRFWLSNEAWAKIWSSAGEISSSVARAARLWRGGLIAAGVWSVVMLLLCGVLLLFGDRTARHCFIVGGGGLAMLLSLAGVARVHAERQLAAWADELGQQLGPTAACSYSWTPEGREPGTVALLIEQRLPPGAELPEAYVTKAAGANLLEVTRQVWPV